MSARHLHEPPRTEGTLPAPSPGGAAPHLSAPGLVPADGRGPQGGSAAGDAAREVAPTNGVGTHGNSASGDPALADGGRTQGSWASGDTPPDLAPTNGFRTRGRSATGDTPHDLALANAGRTRGTSASADLAPINGGRRRGTSAPGSAPHDLALADGTVIRAGSWSWLFPRRTAVVVGALLAVVAVLVVAGVFVGSSGMSLPATLRGLLGTGDPADVMVVRDFRLPRIAVGLLVGAALGVSGCLTQTLAGNRLATPDLIGVNDGASAAVVASVVGSSTGMVGAWWLGPLGAVGAAVLVVLCAGGAGSRGYRVLVVGIGVSTVLGAVTDLVMSRQNANSAGGVFLWRVGSLSGRDWATGTPLLLVLLALLPPALAAGNRLRLLRFDDDTAAGLGVDVRRVRAAALALAVALAGVAVGAGGPIAFVALAAPVLAVRFTGPDRVPVLGSALTGAALVAAADTLGRVVAPVEIPVGVVTSVLGGPFLLWVLLAPETPKA